MSKRDELAEALNDIIVDHPMWIGDDGQPLDYLPEREARIGDFIAEASEALTRMLAAVWDEACEHDTATCRTRCEYNPYRTETPRCQQVSPSPWGPTQCALPDGHHERHAYSPSEGHL